MAGGPISATPTLQVKEVTDIILRSNFQNLQNYFQQQNQFLNFQFIEIDVSNAVTQQSISHNLGVIPQDLIVTKVTGPGSITFLHGQFTSSKMFFSTTGACRCRLYYGTYWNFQTSVNNQNTDSTTYYPTEPGGAASSLNFTQVPLSQVNLTSGAFPGSSSTIYQIQLTDNIIEANLSASPTYTVELPPVALAKGKQYTLFKAGTDTNTLTFKTANSTATDLFSDKTQSKTITAGGSAYTVFSDGTTWLLLTIPPVAFTPKTPNLFVYTASTTYIPSPGVLYIEIEAVGAGGGGGGGGQSAGTGGTGGTTSFGGFASALGGTGGGAGNTGVVGQGGSYSIASVPGSTLIGLPGSGSTAFDVIGAFYGGMCGASSIFSGAGLAGPNQSGGTGAYGGGGGGGGTAGTSASTGGGGGSGGSFKGIIYPSSPLWSASITVTIGTSGGGGAGVSGVGYNGGNGGNGLMLLKEHFQ